MRTCNGFTCRRLEKISFPFGGKIYTDGIKFCKTCGVFMKIDGYRCTCCKSNVRSKSHAKKWKKPFPSSITESLASCIFS